MTTVKTRPDSKLRKWTTRTVIYAPDYSVIDVVVPVTVTIENLTRRKISMVPRINISHNQQVETIYNTWHDIPARSSISFTTFFSMRNVTPTRERPNVFVGIHTYNQVWDNDKKESFHDYMAPSCFVRVKPKDYAFFFAILNAPKEAHSWHIEYRQGFSWAQSGNLNMDSIWYTPFGSMYPGNDYRIFVWDKYGKELYSSTGTVHESSADIYVYNCDTHQLISRKV